MKKTLPRKKPLTVWRRVLMAVIDKGTASAADLVDAVGIASNSMSTQVSHLHAAGAIEVVEKIRGPYGKLRPIWRITPKGREMLASERHLEPRKGNEPVPLKPDVKQRYERDHEAFVEQSKRMGLPNALIYTSCMGEWGEWTKRHLRAHPELAGLLEIEQEAA